MLNLQEWNEAPEKEGDKWLVQTIMLLICHLQTKNQCFDDNKNEKCRHQLTQWKLLVKVSQHN